MSIPDGWNLVPMEPTMHMCMSALGGHRIETCRQVYKHMLAAAPPAPALDDAREREWPDRMADQLRDVETLLTIVAPRSHMREYQRTLTEVRVVIQEYESERARGRG